MDVNNAISPQSHDLILIADDDLASRSLIRRLLEGEGYSVAEAKDGLEALESATRLRPNVILLDAVMPIMDGFEVCKQLQAGADAPKASVIMLTALEGEAFIQQAFEAGVDDYLTKPIQWPVLRHRLRRLMSARHAEHALLQERNLLRTLIDNLPDYIFIKDIEGRFLISNEAHATSVQSTPEALIGKTAFGLFPEELAVQFHADDLAVMRSGTPAINLERLTVDPFGNRRSVLTTKVPLRDADGKIIGLVGISRDITERKEVEKQLKQFTDELTASHEQLQHLYTKVSDLEQLKTTMLRFASHDLRTPLTHILGYSYLLDTYHRKDFSEEAQSYLESITVAANRMQKIIEDILSVEKIQSTPDSSMITVNLSELVEAVFKDNEAQVQQKQQSLTLTVPQEGVYVRADATQLYEAISNLVNNAIKYTAPGGAIEICLTMTTEMACVEIKDTGFGIPDHLQRQLFQPFFRVKTEETSHIDGTGLGLHLVKSVVERHHGHMQFASKYGEGSTFGFQLALINK